MQQPSRGAFDPNRRVTVVKVRGAELSLPRVLRLRGTES
jgi:hypothetical protein